MLREIKTYQVNSSQDDTNALKSPKDMPFSSEKQNRQTTPGPSARLLKMRKLVKSATIIVNSHFYQLFTAHIGENSRIKIDAPPSPPLGKNKQIGTGLVPTNPLLMEILKKSGQNSKYDLTRMPQKVRTSTGAATSPTPTTA